MNITSITVASLPRSAALASTAYAIAIATANLCGVLQQRKKKHNKTHVNHADNELFSKVLILSKIPTIKKRTFCYQPLKTEVFRFEQFHKVPGDRQLGISLH